MVWDRAFPTGRGDLARGSLGEGRVVGPGEGKGSLPRYGRAREPDPRADGQDVANPRVLLLLATLGSAACAEPETIIQKRVSEVQLTRSRPTDRSPHGHSLSFRHHGGLEDGQPVPRFEFVTAADGDCVSPS